MSTFIALANPAAYSSRMGKVTVKFVAVNYDDQSDLARRRTKRKPRRVEADCFGGHGSDAALLAAPGD